MLSSSDCESLRDRRAARARARRRDERLLAICGSATPRCPARRSCARPSPRATSAWRAEDVLDARGRRGGHLPRLPRAARARRSRDRRGALLRLGDRGSRAAPAPCVASGSAATRTAGRTTSTRSSDCSARSTRLIYINSPHNPTGTQMARATFDARSSSSPRARDRAVQRRGLPRPRARPRPRGCRRACDAYERAISLGTVSKAHGLPGLRIGWLACRDRGAARARCGAEALHDDLLERAERTARRARAAPRATSSSPRSRELVLAQPAADRRPARAPRRAVRVGAPDRRADRLPARCAAIVDVRGVVRSDRASARRAAAPRRRLRAAAATCGSASAAPTSPRRSRASTATAAGARARAPSRGTRACARAAG